MKREDQNDAQAKCTAKTLDADAWRFRASRIQNNDVQWTHTRKLDLPTTLDVYLCGCHFKAQYCGHGLSKTVYLLEALDPAEEHEHNGKVLKLCKDPDPEPDVFASYKISNVYPEVYGKALVYELDSDEHPVRQWNGWIISLAVPLDQALRQPGLSSATVGRCVIGAVRCMLRAAKHGHYMDDASPYNFGMLGRDVVIIDAGSHALSPQEIPKATLGVGVKKFFNRVQLFVENSELFVGYQREWRDAQTMDQARAAFEALWNSLAEADTADVLQRSWQVVVSGNGSLSSSAEQPAIVLSSSSAEQPAPFHMAVCPYVAAASHELSEQLLEWLTHNFLWHKLSKYGLLSDGTVGYLGEACTAEVKLELLIRLTTERREKICNNARVDILTETELGHALFDWKNDYLMWMHPQTLQHMRTATNQERHQILRRSFRTFLFHLSGCYEMTLFFLVAPFSCQNLEIFQRAWLDDDSQNAKNAVRQAAGSSRGRS